MPHRYEASEREMKFPNIFKEGEKRRKHMEPQRSQRNSPWPQKEWIKGKDIRGQRIDSQEEDEVFL